MSSFSGAFDSTQWSIVLAAKSSNPAASLAAIETLCGRYWRPLYSYLRRRGCPVEDAQDLTQAYFARLLEKDFLKDVDVLRGKFRSFLLASLNHFVANEWDRRRTLKRGGAVKFIGISELADVEAEYSRQIPVSALTPEQIFERNWALAALRHAMARLEAEFAAQGKVSVFEALKVFLTGDQDGAHYAEIAESLGMTPGAARVSAHRLRDRFRVLLRAEVAQGLPAPVDPARVDEELRFLIAAL